MQTAKQRETPKIIDRTVSGILWGKFLDTLDQSTWGDIFGTLAKLLVMILIVIFIYDFRTSWDFLLSSIEWKEYIIPKIAVAIIIPFGWRIWVQCIIWMKNEVFGIIEQLGENMRRKEIEDLPKWY